MCDTYRTVSQVKQVIKMSRSKEDLLLDEKIAQIRKKNEEIMKRRLVIDEDIRNAEERNATITSQVDDVSNVDHKPKLYSDIETRNPSTVQNKNKKYSGGDEMWREERRVIDDARISRQKRGSGIWSREWDANKQGRDLQDDSRSEISTQKNENRNPREYSSGWNKFGDRRKNNDGWIQGEEDDEYMLRSNKKSENVILEQMDRNVKYTEQNQSFRKPNRDRDEINERQSRSREPNNERNYDTGDKGRLGGRVNSNHRPSADGIEEDYSYYTRRKGRIGGRVNSNEKPGLNGIEGNYRGSCDTGPKGRVGGRVSGNQKLAIDGIEENYRPSQGKPKNDLESSLKTSVNKVSPSGRQRFTKQAVGRYSNDTDRYAADSLINSPERDVVTKDNTLVVSISMLNTTERKVHRPNTLKNKADLSNPNRSNASENSNDTLNKPKTVTFEGIDKPKSILKNMNANSIKVNPGAISRGKLLYKKMNDEVRSTQKIPLRQSNADEDDDDWEDINSDEDL